MTFNSKYSEGDTLWCIEKNKIFHGKVTGVSVQYNTFKDGRIVEGYWFKGDEGNDVYRQGKEVFSSKEELIKSLE